MRIRMADSDLESGENREEARRAMADSDLESGENREEARKAHLPQRRANNRRHGAGVHRPRITRKKARLILGTAKKTAGDHVVQKVGLLGTFYSILFSFLQVEGKANPLSKAPFLVALFICALAVGFKIRVRNEFGNWAADHIINRGILISGALGIVPIVSVLLPDWLSWIFYAIWAIFSFMVMAWNLNVVARFKQRFLVNGGRTPVEPAQGPSNV